MNVVDVDHCADCVHGGMILDFMPTITPPPTLE